MNDFVTSMSPLAQCLWAFGGIALAFVSMLAYWHWREYRDRRECKRRMAAYFDYVMRCELLDIERIANNEPLTANFIRRREGMPPA